MQDASMAKMGQYQKPFIFKHLFERPKKKKKKKTEK